MNDKKYNLFLTPLSTSIKESKNMGKLVRNKILLQASPYGVA
jgi:hypothetical protein